MKAFLKNATTVLSLVGMALAFAAAAGAQAGEGPGRRGSATSSDVTSAYRDGYWDAAGHWRRWDSARDTRNYRNNHAGTYRDWDHATVTVVDGWPAGRSAPGIGSVAYAYRDGYWDRMHRWHRWNDDRDHRNYRNANAANYRDWNHNRDGGDGWRRD